MPARQVQDMVEQYVAVAANIIKRDDEILLVQEGKDHVEGQWNLPAGTLERGESPENCAEREAREETGLNVFPEEFVGTYIGRSDVYEDDVIVFVYHASIVGGDPEAPDDDTVQEVEFVPVEKVASRDLRADYITEAVDDFENGRTYPLSVIDRVR